ncbi:MAG: transglycosylase SLT domain-containing protein [Thermodesulfobacteriota bacterium]
MFTACVPLDVGQEGLGPAGRGGARVEGADKAPELADLAQYGLLKEEVLPEPAEDRSSFYDFPITRNEQVDYYLDFFANKHRKTFARWLSRSGRYLPMIKQKFAKAGLPLDLAYLPMIESGFRHDAVSRASAVGTWQFMRGTGLNYGLTINEYVDERRDPEKSTAAAAAYLSALYDRFDSWHLAVAAYNAGEGTITRAMKQQEVDDFWEIAQGRYIREETKLYVPQLIAAIMIAKEPEKYGFDNIDYETPAEYETVHVPGGTHLKAVALACATGMDDIQDLNQQLCKAITPPTGRHYPLRVPVGKRELVSLNLPRVREVVSIDYKEYTVTGKKETLASVAKKTGVSKGALQKANGIKKDKLTAGQQLRVPVKSSRFVLLDEDELARYPVSQAIEREVPAARVRVAKADRSGSAKKSSGEEGESTSQARKNKPGKEGKKAPAMESRKEKAGATDKRGKAGASGGGEKGKKGKDAPKKPSSQKSGGKVRG